MVPLKRLILVFVVMATCLSMTHAARKSFIELAVPTCVHSVRRPGGVSEFRYSRISLNVYEREQQSSESLRSEGYDPKFAFRGKSSVWTYNCQMADAGRMRLWGEEFEGEYVALQGTQGTYRPECGERALQQWSSDTHDVIEFKVQKKKKKGYSPEGVAVWAPKGMQRLVKRVMVPSAKELEGRGMAVWYSRGLFDLCIVSVYCPLGDRNPENKRRTERLWQWVGCVQSMLPARVCVVVGTDANGHIGSVRHRTVELAEGGQQYEDEYVHVGEYGMETENDNGTLFREYLEVNDMVAVNTRQKGSAGKTWFGGKGCSTRVDYIAVSTSVYKETDRVIVSHEKHRRLRCLVGLEVFDHVPMCYQFKLSPWKTDKQDQVLFDAAGMVRSCITGDDKNRDYCDRVLQVF